MMVDSMVVVDKIYAELDLTDYEQEVLLGLADEFLDASDMLLYLEQMQETEMANWVEFYMQEV